MCKGFSCRTGSEQGACDGSGGAHTHRDGDGQAQKSEHDQGVAQHYKIMGRLDHIGLARSLGEFAEFVEISQQLVQQGTAFGVDACNRLFTFAGHAQCGDLQRNWAVNGLGFLHGLEGPCEFTALEVVLGEHAVNVRNVLLDVCMRLFNRRFVTLNSGLRRADHQVARTYCAGVGGIEGLVAELGELVELEYLSLEV